MQKPAVADGRRTPEIRDFIRVGKVGMKTDNSSPTVKHLYETFSRYTHAGRKFCTFCYSSEEIKRITQTQVDILTPEDGRMLLWEASDHWESASVYRHYLPRLLEILGPPWMIEDLFPLHLFEVLIAIEFRKWPDHERDVVIEYLEHVGPEIERRWNDEDRAEWASGLAALKDPTLTLPAISRDGTTIRLSD